MRILRVKSSHYKHYQASRHIYCAMSRGVRNKRSIRERLQNHEHLSQSYNFVDVSSARAGNAVRIEINDKPRNNYMNDTISHPIVESIVDELTHGG